MGQKTTNVSSLTFLLTDSGN